MICPNCGSQIPDGAAFCGNCGNAVAAPSAAAPEPPAASQGWQQPAQPQQENQAQGYGYGYSQPQQAYQQPYGQPQPVPQPAQQAWPPQGATNRAFAMTIYVANLLGVIFALCVRDKDNAFITHHLNNAVVILIGSVVGSLLTIVAVGFVLLVYLLVMAIMGIVSAYNGDMKELPLIGKIHIVK